MTAATTGALPAAAQVVLADVLHATRRDEDSPVNEIVVRVLRAIRRHLGLEIALVSDFTQADHLVRYVDTGQEHRTVEIPSLRRRWGGILRRVDDAPLGIAVLLPSGQAYGRLALLGCDHRDHPDTDAAGCGRGVLLLLAELLGEWLGREEPRARLRAEQQLRIEQVLAAPGLDIDIVFQPVVDLTGETATTSTVVGFEALSRFAASPARPPDQWFSEAASVGLGVPLELAAIRAAVTRVADLPAGTYLAVNASAPTLLSPELAAALAPAPADRLVVELTEHTEVADYPGLRRALASLRAGGVRVAVDDTGAGYAGLDSLLGLEPDIVKLDLSLCQGVATDPARQAMVWALSWFARKTGATLVAEGIENPQDLHELSSLGVPFGQGFLLGRPGPLPAPPGR